VLVFIASIKNPGLATPLSFPLPNPTIIGYSYLFKFKNFGIPFWLFVFAVQV
jgi:hypothetical protein